MSGAHIRCSDQVHKKLKEMALNEGVALSQALEILVSTIPPEDSKPEPGPEAVPMGLFRQEPNQRDLAKAVDTLTDNLTTIRDRLEGSHHNSGRFTEAQKLDIAQAIDQGLAEQRHWVRLEIEEVIANAFEEQKYMVELAQENHQHGGDPSCQACRDVMADLRVQEHARGHQCKLDYFKNIPGVMELVKAYEDAKFEFEIEGYGNITAGELSTVIRKEFRLAREEQQPVVFPAHWQPGRLTN